MANTIIQFKRSNTNPVILGGNLAPAQPAYSFASDKMFLGNQTGAGVLTIGGQMYTAKIDQATSANGSNNLVMRDLTGNAAFNYLTATRHIGPADTLFTPRYIATTGDVTANAAFDGSTNIQLSSNLSTTGVSAGIFGGAGNLASFQVDTKGRIISASNIAFTAGGSFTIQGNTGTTSVISAGDTFIIDGLDGITTDGRNNDRVVINVDSTVVRTSGTQTINGSKTFGSDVIITGNLTVTGTRTFANTTQLDLGDNIIVLNADLPLSAAPSEDAGIEVNRGNVNGNVRIFWDETNDYWAISSNTLLTSASTRIFSDAYANATAMSIGTVPSARISGSYTGITGVGTIVAGTWNGSNIGVSYGGTGRSSFTTNGILYGNNTGDLKVTAAGTEGMMLQFDSSGVPFAGHIDGGSF